MADNNQDDARRLARNTVLLFVRMVIVLLVTLYTSRAVLKALGVEDFGIYNVVGSVVVFLGSLKAALTNATSRYLTYELGTGNVEKLRQVFSMAVNCHIILAAGLWVVMEIGGVWFVNHQLNISPERLTAANWVFQFSLLTFCLSVVQTPFHSNIVAHEKMDYYAFLSVLDAVLKLGIVFLLAFSPVDKLIAYAFLLFLVSLVMLVCYALYSSRKFDDTKYLKYWDGGLLLQFTSYSGWSLLVNGVVIAAQQCISIFFFNILGSVANASLGFANQVSAGIAMFIANFSQSYKPQIVKSYAAGNTEFFNRLLFSTSKISFILYLLISVPIVANVGFILELWLDDYPQFTPEYVIAVIAYFLFDCFQEPLWQAVHATGKIRAHQIMIASIKVIAIPAMYIALKSGCSGEVALYIWAALNAICAIARTLYMHYLIDLDLKEYFRKVAIPISMLFVLVVPLPIIISKLLGPGVTGFLISSAVAVTLTILVGVGLVLDKSERGILKGIPLIGKFFNRQ